MRVVVRVRLLNQLLILVKFLLQFVECRLDFASEVDDVLFQTSVVVEFLFQVLNWSLIGQVLNLIRN